MKTDRKIKAEKSPPKTKTIKGSRRSAVPKTNGKHPLAAYEHIPIGIVEASLDGKYMDVNQEFCRILGYSRQELLRLGINDCTHEDDYGLDIKLHEQLVAGKIPFYKLEKRFVRKDGGITWVELTRTLVRDEKGKSLHTAGVVLDISDRKDVESVLRDSAERLRLATAAAQMFMWEWDFQSQSYILADNFEQVLGFSAGLLPRNKFETLWALSPEEDLQRISEGFEEAVEHQRDLHALPYRVINPENSQIVWLEISAKIVYDREGNPERMFGVAQNITESKKTQDEIAVISRMPEENPNPVMRLTVDGEVLYANPASVPLVEDWKQGAEHGERMIPEELQNAITEAFTSGVKTEVEIEHRGKVFSCTLAPIREAGYVNLYGKDVTERKQKEEWERLSAEANAKFRTFFDQGSYFAGVMTLDGTILEANRLSLEFAGFTREDIIGKKFWDCGWWNPSPALMEMIERGTREAAEGKIFRQESNYFVADGSKRYVDLIISPVRDENSRLLFLAPTGTDITERKQAEKRNALLAEVSELLRNADDPNELMYTISKAVGEHLHVKRALFNEIDLEHDREIVHRDYHSGVESVTGLHKVSEYSRITSAEVAAGKTVINVDSKTDPRTAQDYEKTYALSGERSYVVVPMMRDSRWVASLWVSDDEPRNWSQDEVSLLETVAERTWTVIEKLRIAEELRAKEAELEKIINQTPFMLTRCSRDLRYRFVSRAYAEMIGRTPEQVAGKTIVEIMGEEGLKTISPYVEKVLSGTQVEFETEVPFRNAGAPFLHVVYTPDRDEHDNVIGWFASIVDISERKRAEEALRESEQRYRFIVENTSDGIWWIELTEPMPISLPEDEQIEWYYKHAVIRQCNLGLARMYGYHTVEEVTGLPLRIVMPPDDPLNLELSRKFIRSGYRLVDSESSEISRDGRELVFLNNMVGILEDGKLKGEWGTNRDITERKQAEEALRQSEERFARFMHHLPGLAWIKDMQGRYIYANAAAEHAFNTPREKLYGQTDEDIFRPEVAAQFKRNDEQALTDEKGVQVIETLKHADGVLHSSLVNKFPIPGPDGSTTLIGGTAFDITERLKAEEALRESEERFSAILRQATAGIVRKDAEGCLIFVNEAFCNMLGRTEAELLGKTMWELMHQDDVAENQRSYQRLMLEGIPFKLERRFLREDGSLIWVDASVSPIMDATGKPQSAVAVEVDITGRKQAEEALRQLNLQLEDRVLSRTAKLRAVNQTLREEIAERKKAEESLRKSEAAARENEEKLSTLFELLPVGISFLDLQGQIIQMNPALANILKLSKGQSLDQDYKSRTYIRANGSLMPPTEFASQRALAEGKTVYNIETGVVLEDSDLVWTSVSAAPVNVGDVGAVVVTVDITESKRAERALQESRERLQILSQRLVEVQEEERRAIARELHDRVGQTLAALNINLIIINGQLGDKVDEQISTRLNDSMKLVAETIALVRDVMSNLRPSVLDDYGLEAALESHLSQYVSRYEIKVKYKKPDQPIPRMVPSIEMTFLRIAQEALMNIARHAHATQVDLSLKQEEDAIHMTIQDNGTGIESWQQANRPGSHGLTIMRERAEAFGGSLKVSSVSGKGTKVEVRIPVETNNPSQDQKGMSQ